MGETATAVFLRMSYVAASVLFVLVVNRFFFPTSLRSQFRYNLQMLFHMHHMYLRILEDALTNPPDYWRICDAQLQYPYGARPDQAESSQDCGDTGGSIEGEPELSRLMDEYARNLSSLYVLVLQKYQ